MEPQPPIEEKPVEQQNVQPTPSIPDKDVIRDQSEWRDYEKVKIPVGVLKSEYDQKVNIINIETARINFDDILTLVTKELDTSFINDVDLKVFYQILFENVLEWANMGLKDLAKIRLSKLFAELKLEKSVGGFERLLQASTLTGNVSAGLPTKSKLFPVEVLREKERERNMPQINPALYK